MRSIVIVALLSIASCTHRQVGPPSEPQESVRIIEPVAAASSAEERSDRWHRSLLFVGESTPTEIDEHVRLQLCGEHAFERREHAPPGSFGEREVTYSSPEKDIEYVFLLDEEGRYLWGPGYRDRTNPTRFGWAVGQSTGEEVRAVLSRSGLELEEREYGGTGHYEITHPLDPYHSVVFVFDFYDRLCHSPWVRRD